MNVNPQYWFILAALTSLTIAVTVALSRSRSLSAILYGCSAWLALFSIAGLILEPVVANETFVAPDGSVEIHYNATLHTIMDWGLMFSALLIVAGSAAYVLAPNRFYRSSVDHTSNKEPENQLVD